MGQSLDRRAIPNWVILYNMEGVVVPPIHVVYVGKDNVMGSGRTHMEIMSTRRSWVDRALELGIVIKEE